MLSEKGCKQAQCYAGFMRLEGILEIFMFFLVMKLSLKNQGRI